MSDRITADLAPRAFGDDGFARLLYHDGDSDSPLKRWVALLRSAGIPQGWPAIRQYAGRVMQLLADSRVLFTAAGALRSRGPKAPGPDGLRLEALDRSEVWAMCAALAQAIAAGTYRPGPERVVWVKKASGCGRRPIVVCNVQDRVVQKALAMVLRPVLDGRFDPLSFAYRPARSREHGLAAAGVVAGTHPVWLTHDIKDAFGSVPLGRLLDIVFKWLPCPRLGDFLKLVLPPQARSLGGIKQGGPLSPLMLEVYLTHALHEPWRRAGHGAYMMRYADDLLVVAADATAAGSADGALRALLDPAGMPLKSSFADALADIRVRDAEWLGFRLRLGAKGLEAGLGAGALDGLGRRLVLAHAKCRPAERAGQVLRHWFGQLGPCFAGEDRTAVLRGASEAAVAHGFEELPADYDLERLWHRAYLRWRQTRRHVRGTPGYFAPGPLAFPTPTSEMR